MDRSFLYRLLETVSVSGLEEANQENALAFGKSFAHAQWTDPAGNAFSAYRPDAPVRVLLTGHMDEIGMRVTWIGDDGMVHVQRAGGIRPKLYVGSPMQIIHEAREGDRTVRRRVLAVGAVTDELLKKEEMKDTDLLLDIGCDSREEAEKTVSVGDAVCADTQVRELLGDRISCRALDDKTGAFVILEAARQAAQTGTANGVIAHTAVGEETTGRGAYFAASRLKPTCVIAVDVTWASDCPGTDPGKTGKVKLGGGPVLCHSGMVNRRMNERLARLARERDIPVQYEVAGAETYTDGDTMALSGEGIPVALVSIPLRYMHSSVEVASWKDLAWAAELIAAFASGLEEDFDFCPIRP